MSNAKMWSDWTYGENMQITTTRGKKQILLLNNMKRNDYFLQQAIVKVSTSRIWDKVCLFSGSDENSKRKRFKKFLKVFDIFFVVLFLIEYLCSLISYSTC